MSGESADRKAFDPRSAYRAWRTIETRWSDNDVYGHVNNVVFYQWFDTAVNAWMIDHGILDPVAGDPIGLVVETGCRYFAPLSFPGRVDVGLRVARIGTSSLVWQIGVFGEGEDDPAAQGHFAHVCVDRASRRPVPVPEIWRERLAGLVTGD